MQDDLLDRVNREVNKLITPMSDMEQYGVWEKWVMNPSSNMGDCEDYALTKLNRLVNAGFPARRCNIYVIRHTSGEFKDQLHAILVIDRTLVLDNLRDEIVPLSTLPYRVMRIY